MGIVAENNHYNKVYKRFVLWLVGVAIGVPCLIAFINYKLDTYGVFGNTATQFGSDKIIKIDYLRKNHQKYDSYIIGNSRVGGIAPSTMERYIPNSRFYNAKMGGSNLIDSQIFIDYITREHYTVKNLYLLIGMDYTGCGALVSNLETDNLGQMWHYEVSGMSKLKFYSQFLLGATFRAYQIMLQDFIRSNIGGNINRLVPSTVLDSGSSACYKLYPKDKKTLQGIIDSIAQDCETNKAHCIVVTAPLYFNIINTLGQQYREEVIELLANTLPSGFWHFGYYNSVTVDNQNYHDPIHHNSSVNELMLARIFNDKSVSVPEDFGILITKENLKQSLEKIRAIESRYNH